MYSRRRREFEDPRVQNCGHRSFKHIGTSGNPYEGGVVYSRCAVCGIVKGSSEDGTEYFPKSFQPYFRTIADDMRSVGLNPDTASDEDIINFLGG
jgi:hypothetical protein